MALGGTAAETGKSDPIVTRLAKEDKRAWYQKPNLRLLYMFLFPACMGIELTSGFDSQMINALQIVPSWKLCEYGPSWPSSVDGVYTRVLDADLLVQTSEIKMETRVPS